MTVRRRSAFAARAALAAAAFALAAPPAPGAVGPAASVQVDLPAPGTRCPATANVHGKVEFKSATPFTYSWRRSDGAADPGAPHSASYDGVHPTILHTSWALTGSTNGWIELVVNLRPGPPALTASAAVRYDCPPPPPTIVPGAVGGPRLPAGAVPPAPHLARPTFEAPVLLLPAVLPVPFRGLDGKTQPAGPYDLELKQQPGSDAILIGLLRAGKRVGETSGKFVPGATQMDDWEARARRGFRFGAQSKVSFLGNAGKVGCTNEVKPGSPDPAAIEFLLPAIQK